LTKFHDDELLKSSFSLSLLDKNKAKQNKKIKADCSKLCSLRETSFKNKSERERERDVSLKIKYINEFFSFFSSSFF
jgi:hypothetical protein